MGVLERYEADDSLNTVLQRVRTGQQVILTKHGVDVARVLPATPRDQGRVDAAVEGLRQFARSHSLGGLRIKDLVDEGRKY
jgi:prevent-host-death family protein